MQRFLFNVNAVVFIYQYMKMEENSGCCFVSCFPLMDSASLARGPGQ